MFFSSADFLTRLQQSLSLISKRKPEVLSITSHIGSDLLSNGLLAIGASPLTSHSADEMRELVSISDVVNISVGLLDPYFLELLNVTMMSAKQQDKSVVFNAAGAGKSDLRTRSAIEFAESSDVLCGNADEILAMYKRSENSRSWSHFSFKTDNISPEEAGKVISERNGQVIIITGENNLIMSETLTQKLRFGSQMLSKVSGSSCLLNGIIATFHSLSSISKMSSFELSTLGIAYFNLCSEQAEKVCRDSGTLAPSKFTSAFLDSLYAPDWNLIETLADERWC